jgi:hypothetical protein
METDRRSFLKLSVAGATALSTLSTGAMLSGCASSTPAAGMKYLRAEDVELLRALTPAVLKGKVSASDTAGIDQTLHSFDTLLGDLSDQVVGGVQQAFDVLCFAPTRALMTGQWSAWSKASVKDAERALARLRESSIELLNAIYAATIRLIVSAWYLIPQNAATAAYPGPPKKVEDTASSDNAQKEVTP